MSLHKIIWVAWILISLGNSCFILKDRMKELRSKGVTQKRIYLQQDLG